MSDAAPRPEAGAPDAEALLVALTLAPATYSRNRFFAIYADPAVREVRKRAAVLRGIVRHLAPRPGRPEASEVELKGHPDGAVELRYEVPELGLRRTARLDALEAALVRYVVARADAGPKLGDPDEQRIVAALGRLAPMALGTRDAARGSAEEE